MGDTPPKHTGCCDPFDPAPWRDRELTWTNEPFVRARVRAFLHIPLNMGATVTATMAKVVAAQAAHPVQLMLSDEDSLWGSDVYIHVTRDVPGATMAPLTGTFFTRVYEGPYRMVGRWMRDMEAAMAARGTPAQKLYASYTTCPRCAKAYGKNYVVLFAKVA